MTTLKRRAEIRMLVEEAADTAVGLHNLGLSMKRDDHWQISAARVLDAARIMKGRDGETRLDPKDDSAGPQDIAQGPGS